MTNILVIGAGGVGSSMASIGETRTFFDSFVLADISEARAEKALASLEDRGRFSTARVDAADRAGIVELARRVEADVIVNACDPRFNESIFAAAFEAGCSYVDMAMNLSRPHPTRPYSDVGVPLGEGQLAADQAWRDKGLLALVGMGCQTSSPPVMWDRKAGKVSKPFLFNIGLLCSKTFDDAIFEELFLAKYGLRKEEMVKMNIKGVFQIWMRDGSYHEIDLKECHQWTREGCKTCPDFAAEHADISTGGIGEDNDWTLCVVRTELGEEVMNRMIKDGSVVARPAETDEKAMKLLRLLSVVSRRRWPDFAEKSVKVGVPPPKKKADGSAPAAH